MAGMAHRRPLLTPRGDSQSTACACKRLLQVPVLRFFDLEEELMADECASFCFSGGIANSDTRLLRTCEVVDVGVGVLFFSFFSFFTFFPSALIGVIYLLSTDRRDSLSDGSLLSLLNFNNVERTTFGFCSD